MASTNLNQLFLLADHIKLSLLERQRAISLNLAPNSQDNQISRSLESLREGLESLELQSSSESLSSELSHLRSQYNDLSRQLHGENPSSTATDTLTSPNDPSLASDFTHAQSRTSISDSNKQAPQPFSKLKQNNTATASNGTPNQQQSKSVRFLLAQIHPNFPINRYTCTILRCWQNKTNNLILYPPALAGRGT